MKKIFLGLCVLIFLVGCKETSTKIPGPCDGRQWSNSKEELDCKFPPPPVGRWHAVYTEEFAQEHNLPPENISTNLSSGVDYMEMDVQPYGKGGTACLVNMLVKKPHDIALYPAGTELAILPEKRELTHFININKFKETLKPTASFSAASRDYKHKKQGYRTSTFAMYAEDVLPDYDYLSADLRCRKMSLTPKYFPDQYTFWINKASIWGRYENKYRRYEDPERPKGQDFYNSHFFINIPQELVLTIFEDVPIGGR